MEENKNLSSALNDVIDSNKNLINAVEERTMQEYGRMLSALRLKVEELKNNYEIIKDDPTKDLEKKQMLDEIEMHEKEMEQIKAKAEANAELFIQRKIGK